MNSAILWLWVSESYLSHWSAKLGVIDMCIRCCARACASSEDSMCMCAQFCVYACVLLLVGAHGCTGWFADKVKLTIYHIFWYLNCSLKMNVVEQYFKFCVEFYQWKCFSRSQQVDIKVFLSWCTGIIIYTNNSPNVLFCKEPEYIWDFKRRI